MLSHILVDFLVSLTGTDMLHTEKFFSSAGLRTAPASYAIALALFDQAVTSSSLQANPSSLSVLKVSSSRQSLTSARTALTAKFLSSVSFASLNALRASSSSGREILERTS